MALRRKSMNTSLKNARIFDEDSNEEVNLSSFTPVKIKEETKDEGEDLYDEILTNTVKTVKIEKIEVKTEVNDDDSNFPISRETFEKFSLKSEQSIKFDYSSPIKSELDEDSNSRKSFKSAKMSFKKRESPYKRNDGIFGRLGDIPEPPPAPRISGDSSPVRQKKKRQTKKSNEMESDPQVLARRQKQIDYGKNTLCYENYVNTVPKYERKQDDPQTPNKYHKYSRRGWDGLIRQWRLKLHKYDPKDEEESSENE